jgi:hypothetical protein
MSTLLFNRLKNNPNSTTTTNNNNNNKEDTDSGDDNIREDDQSWLDRKLLMLELWTGAYMLDRWEKWVIFLVPVLIIIFGVWVIFVH